jgi:hypothetical protein
MSGLPVRVDASALAADESEWLLEGAECALLLSREGSRALTLSRRRSSSSGASASSARAETLALVQQPHAEAAAGVVCTGVISR